MPRTFSIFATQILRIKGNTAIAERKLADMISNLIQIVFPGMYLNCPGCSNIIQGCDFAGDSLLLVFLAVLQETTV